MNDNYFTIGAQVYCEDGKCGKLAKVVLDPESWQVTDLVAEEGILVKRARVFPTSIVASATAEQVHLAISSDKISQYPEYSEHEYEMLPTEWDPAIRAAPEVLAGETAVHEVNLSYTAPGTAIPMVRQKTRIGVEDNRVVAGKNTDITGSTGSLGRLHCLMTEAQSDRITGLMLRAGLLDNEHMLVPARLIESFTDERIRVSANKGELEETNIDVADLRPANRQPNHDVNDGVNRSLTSHPLPPTTAAK